MSTTRIRSYVTTDRDACLAVLRSNVPEHFVAGDEADLGRFLDDLPGPYFVVEARGARSAERADSRGAKVPDDEAPDGAILACGGIAADADPSLATLCWGIVDAARHRRGVGTALLEHRLAAFLPSHPSVTRLRVNTTQKVQGFFERHGFRVTEVRPNAYGPGLDHVRMERVLAPPRGRAG